MSTTRSTLSQATSLNQKIESFKEPLVFPKLSEPKIIFVETYYKNRNLSKSLKIKLPYVNQKSSTNSVARSTEEKVEVLKPILKTKTKFRTNNTILTVNNINNLNNDYFNSNKDFNEKNKKTVKFADEVESDNEEEKNVYFDKENLESNNIIKGDERNKNNTEVKNNENKENVNNNLNKNENKNKENLKNTNINIEKDKDNIVIKDNYKRMNKDQNNIKQNTNSNINTEDDINKDNIEENKSNKKLNFKYQKKSLVEVINVPSYRNLNIYRFNNKDQKKYNHKDDEAKANCKCCLIF